MANLQETATWEVGIRQLEVTDPVIGGPDGIDNIAPRQLANRTLYLKGQVDSLRSGLNQTNSNVTNLGTGKEDKTVVAALAGRIAELEKKAAVFAVGGGMVLWQKPANLIPTGWREVTNWRGRLPMGYDPNDSDFNTIGGVGGEKRHTLTIDEMPNHSHGFSYTVPNITQLKQGDNSNTWDFPSGNIVRTATTDHVGGSGSHNILNPYRIVIFIEYAG